MARHKATFAGREVEYEYTLMRHIVKFLLRGDKIRCNWFLRLCKDVPTHYVYENGKLIETYTIAKLNRPGFETYNVK